MAEHRVSMMRAALRRRVDPTHSRDPRVRAVVAGLATLPLAPDPDPQFRAELRAQLVAIAPRIVAESAPSVPTVDRSDRRAAAGAHTDKRRHVPFGRLAAVTTAVVAVLALVGGGLVWFSRNALPGDTLYGVKRASENVRLAFAGSDRDKALDYLQLAQKRVGEAQSLLNRSHGAVDAATGKLVVSTLASSDSDVKDGARLLDNDAARTKSPAGLTTMTSWAPGQVTRLHVLAAALPAGALRTRAASSARLVTAALQRATQLRTHPNAVSTDDLGANPCAGACTTTGAAGRSAGTGAGGTAGTAGPRSGGGAVGGGNGGTATGSAAKSGTQHGARNSPTPVVGVPKLGPSGIVLPTSLPKLSVPKAPGLSAGTCGISVSAAGIGLGIKVCPSGH